VFAPHVDRYLNGCKILDGNFYVNPPQDPSRVEGPNCPEFFRDFREALIME
jgi:hypothetical protein